MREEISPNSAPRHVLTRDVEAPDDAGPSATVADPEQAENSLTTIEASDLEPHGRHPCHKPSHHPVRDACGQWTSGRPRRQQPP